MQKEGLNEKGNVTPLSTHTARRRDTDTVGVVLGGKLKNLKSAKRKSRGKV